MKHILTYKHNNKKYKKYIITKVKSDKHDDVYINLYENLYYTKKTDSFSCIYYYNEFEDDIVKYLIPSEQYTIAFYHIVYETNDLSDAIETLRTISKSEKYNL